MGGGTHDTYLVRSAQETAVSLFVYSLVGGGAHDTNVPPVDAHV